MPRELIDDRLIGALHVRALDRAGFAHEPDEEHAAFQIGTLDALMAGRYDGDTTVGELLAHGDLGLGTVAALDGELVVVDGEAFVVDGDAVVHPVPDGTTTHFAVVCRFAPLAEELFFRQQLFGRIRRGGGPLAAYLSSALIFAAFHNNLQGLVVYIWLGLVFASAYARTGRISAAIAVHFGNNAFTLVALLTAS